MCWAERSGSGYPENALGRATGAGEPDRALPRAPLLPRGPTHFSLSFFKKNVSPNLSTIIHYLLQ